MTRPLLTITFFLCLLLNSMFAFSWRITPDSIPGLTIFNFKSTESKVLPGLTGEESAKKAIDETDRIGNLGLVALQVDGYSFTDGRYNNNDYKVEKGTISSSGKGSKMSFEAYRIYPPTGKFKKFLASAHCVYMRFDKKEDYTIYSMENGALKKVSDVKQGDIAVGNFITIQMNVSDIENPITLFAVPSSVRISSFTLLSPTAEAARVNSSVIGRIFKYRYAVEARPASGDRNTRRFYFPVKSADNSIKVIWQAETRGKIFVTNAALDLKSARNIVLPSAGGSTLAAATTDPEGNLYYLTVESQVGQNGDDKLVLSKVNKDGKLLTTQTLNTAKGELNFLNWSEYPADLAYYNGQIALMIGRIMHTHSDGLNHQGGIAVLYNATNLKLIRNYGQTSGHSFDNYLTTAGMFLGIDLGDNYPRGINLHKFDSSNYMKSRVVYTFKTNHGRSPTSPAGQTYPEYKEINGGGVKFYKWSNDNDTYTELGGVVELNDGYLVVFAGEPDAQGRALQNAQAINGYQRNLGFVKIRKDFENATGFGNKITDDLVLSKGITEEGGFYSFGGSFSEQRNAGVNWLTSYKSVEEGSVEHIKIAKIKNDVLVLWDESVHHKTFAARLDGNGKIIQGPIELGPEIKLTRRDAVLVMDNKVFIATGNGVDQKLELVVMEIK